MRAPTFHADFLSSVIARKSALPRNWSEEIDILLMDFNTDSSLAELTETLLSVAVAIVKQNADLRDDEIRQKVCTHLKFVVKCWAMDQNEGEEGEVVDPEQFERVRKIVMANQKLWNFTEAEIAETFSGEIIPIGKAFEKVKTDSNSVDRNVNERKKLIAELYADKITEILSKFDNLSEAFSMADLVIDQLAKLSDTELTDEKLVMEIMVKVITEIYGDLLGSAAGREA